MAGKKATKPIARTDDDLDDLDDVETLPPDDGGIDEVLQELGGIEGHTFSIFRTEPKWAFVTRVPAAEFDLNRFAKEHGGGAYEIRVFRANSSGIVRKQRFNIDGAPRSPSAPSPNAPAQSFDINAMLMAMMQQNAQIVSAIVSRPAPTPPAIDPTILSLLVSKSPVSELGEILKLSRQVSGDNGGTNWAEVLRAAGDTLPRLSTLLPPSPTAPRGPLPPPRPPAEAQKRALAPISPYGRSERGVAGPTPDPQSPAPNGTLPIQAGNSPAEAPTGAPTGPGGGQRTVQEAIQAVFAPLATDPNPMPVLYTAALIQAIGPEMLGKAVNGTPEGELASTVEALIGPAPDGFLDAIEDMLREQFEIVQPPDPAAPSAALRIDTEVVTDGAAAA